MLGVSYWMSSYGQRCIFMYVLGTFHRSCERKSSYVRDASAIAAWVRGTGLVFILCCPQRASAAGMEASNNSCFIHSGKPTGTIKKYSNYWRDSVVIDVAPIVRANSDCRAAHSITGLTGCNPTCIAAPAASPEQ